jgi:hypothetical protein
MLEQKLLAYFDYHKVVRCVLVACSEDAHNVFYTTGEFVLGPML